MKVTKLENRKMRSFVLILCVLCLSSFRPALGQNGARRLVADSNTVRLGPDQVLRITINGQAGNDKLIVQFRRMYYVGSANGGIWKTTNVVQETSGPVPLAADEVASIDISQAGFDAVRGEVIIRGYTGTTNVNAGVLFQIIRASTGEVITAWEDTDVVQI